MGYPGDQRPPLQPRPSSDRPQWHTPPPYEAADDPAVAYGSWNDQTAPRTAGGDPSYGAEQPPHGSPSHPDRPPYGEPPYRGEAPFGSPYGDSQYGDSQYGGSPYGAAPQGVGRSPYGDAPQGGDQQYTGPQQYAPQQYTGPQQTPQQAPRQGPVHEAPAGGAGDDDRGGPWAGPTPSRKPPAPAAAEPEWDPYAVPIWRRPIALIGGLILLVGALFLGLWVAAKNQPPPQAQPPAPKPSSTQPVPAGAAGRYGYAASRATDKEPLSAAELFGKKKVVNHGRSYLRTAWRKEKTCADGVTGPTITKALKTAGCNQLLRASYRDAKGKVIGTVGVANLKTSSGAKKVAAAGGGGERKDYLKPLPGKDDVSKHLGSGEAYAGGWTHGHYAVLLWFQFQDGHKPSKSDLKRLYQTAVDITDATVFPAFDTRSLTGGHG
ncbi:hypothetical protein JOL79_13565 [Microbispora sp. RL4-1S]|uniref:Uncharacterized protein n=1 Tax=Microbispora oryzae TaxID=2806554 RepID=A0A940WHC9_9ACTN|nr:hypothetical protein [Microbispora oryzae]MBP2704843.1 hypothetical protein [Microbispora oryzae]